MLTGNDACLAANRLLDKEDCRAAAEAAGVPFADLDGTPEATTTLPTGCSILRAATPIKYNYQSHTDGDALHPGYCQPADYAETTLHFVCLCAAAAGRE